MKLLLLTTFLLSLVYNETPKGRLILDIQGIEVVEGNIAIAGFNNEKGFPEEIENAIIKIEVKVTSKEMLIDLGTLPYGNYAFSIIQDINANGELDKNMIGIPEEPFAFSNTKHIFFGLPNFDKATINLNEKNQKATISLIDL